jgi:hypothetical protein
MDAVMCKLNIVGKEKDIDTFLFDTIYINSSFYKTNKKAINLAK